MLFSDDGHSSDGIDAKGTPAIGIVQSEHLDDGVVLLDLLRVLRNHVGRNQGLPQGTKHVSLRSINLREGHDDLVVPQSLEKISS